MFDEVIIFPLGIGYRIKFDFNERNDLGSSIESSERSGDFIKNVLYLIVDCGYNPLYEVFVNYFDLLNVLSLSEYYMLLL